MNKRIKTLLWTALAVAVIAGIYFAYGFLSERFAPDLAAVPTSSADGKAVAAPDFTVTDANGDEVRLSDFLGKPVVLNFWASWCPPCKAEMPDFEKAYGEMKEDVQFLMVNMTDGKRETVDTAAQFIANSGYTFPVFYDTAYEAASAYGIRSIPTTFFIDSGGYVLAVQEGQLSETTLRKGLALIRANED